MPAAGDRDVAQRTHDSPPARLGVTWDIAATHIAIIDVPRTEPNKRRSPRDRRMESRHLGGARPRTPLELMAYALARRLRRARVRCMESLPWARGPEI